MIMGTRENVFSTHILALKFNFMADTSFFRLFGTYIFLSFDNVAIGWLIRPFLPIWRYFLNFNFMADTSFFRLFGTYVFLSFDNVAIGWLILPPDQPKKEVSANLLRQYQMKERCMCQTNERKKYQPHILPFFVC